MSKWVVEMKKLCNFCQGAKGYCGYYDIIRGHSCAGDLTRRPEWCPVTPLDEILEKEFGDVKSR